MTPVRSTECGRKGQADSGPQAEKLPDKWPQTGRNPGIRPAAGSRPAVPAPRRSVRHSGADADLRPIGRGDWGKRRLHPGGRMRVIAGRSSRRAVVAVPVSARMPVFPWRHGPPPLDQRVARRTQGPRRNEMVATRGQSGARLSRKSRRGCPRAIRPDTVPAQRLTCVLARRCERAMDLPSDSRPDPDRSGRKSESRGAKRGHDPVP